jgi:hypothetical protein
MTQKCPEQYLTSQVMSGYLMVSEFTYKSWFNDDIILSGLLVEINEKAEANAPAFIL